MDQGPYLLLALEVDKLLLNGRWRMQINITGLDAALSADMGLNPREHHLFMTTCFLAGMPPCFIDAYNKPEGTFFPLRCTRIQYEGKNRRTWGRNEELKSILESR
jgi:citrate synthase